MEKSVLHYYVCSVFTDSATIILAIFYCLPTWLIPCLIHSFKHSGKLATTTELLLWWKYFEYFAAKKTFHNLNNYTFHYSLTALVLILLCGRHWSRASLPSNVFLYHIIMHHNKFYCFWVCMLRYYNCCVCYKRIWFAWNEGLLASRKSACTLST